MTTAPVSVPIAKWGVDHWSTFGYIETRIVDCKGVPDRAHMRCDIDLHPGLAGFERGRGLSREEMSKKYPTRLKDDELQENHDDWCCLDDAETEGLLENVGTGIHRVYRLTPKGRAVAAKLRDHKGAGKNFASFSL